MARYLTIGAVLVAIGLSAALLLVPQQPPNNIADPAPESPLRAAPVSRTADLDEFHVPPARPSLTTEACRDARERSDEERMAEYEVQRNQMLRVLGASADPEHLLIAASISWTKQPDRAAEMLARAAAMDPRNPLIASQALELCFENETCTSAPTELERRLIAADKANAMAWVQVARSRLGRNDESGALAAMREATAAPEINIYFTDNVLLFERGLAAATDLPAFNRMTAAIGHAAAILNTTSLILRDCLERAKNSAEWRDVCLRLGQQLEHGGRTILLQTIGANMQAKMYQYGGDSREQLDVEARHDRFKEEWSPLARQTYRSEQLRDATVIRRYLETFESAGELAAMRYLAAEVEARLPPPADAANSACPTP